MYNSYHTNLHTLQSIDDELERMSVESPSGETTSYIVRYKGKRLTMSSGKNVWTKEHHAKAAVRCHFEHLCTKYQYPPIAPYVDPTTGKEHANFDYSKPQERKKEFYDKLMSMVEIVELDVHASK